MRVHRGTGAQGGCVCEVVLQRARQDAHGEQGVCLSTLRADCAGGVRKKGRRGVRVRVSDGQGKLATFMEACIAFAEHRYDCPQVVNVLAKKHPAADGDGNSATAGKKRKRNHKRTADSEDMNALREELGDLHNEIHQMRGQCDFRPMTLGNQVKELKQGQLSN